MNTISIMQPTFLPWAGYFKMILNSDIFVFLDDVQFDKRSWQQRNKILGNNGKDYMLTVPVKSKGKFYQRINEVEIDNTKNWSDKHLKSLKMNYSNHKFFNYIFDDINEIYNEDNKRLYELNIKLIKKICNLLDIKKNFLLSSDLSIDKDKKKVEKIIEIVKKLDAKKYLSPISSQNYIGEGQELKKNGIQLEYFQYKPKEYFQKNSNSFKSHLSIIDMVFNLGVQSKNYI